MTDDDITRALECATAASPGPATWSFDPDETEEQAVERFLKAYRVAKELTGTTGIHTVELERNDDGSCLVVAFTGNGPMSAMNARCIAGSFDPVAGWAAALIEVRRLRAQNASLLHDLQLRHA